ncbi:hypothetical protein K492DRAFT_211982 [Lichtheimia hyalospora FSU 10163]|nr:hypothetical protein K492DRAFT_211982 [Lichtheimia hyalospora FSU 10163]
MTTELQQLIHELDVACQQGHHQHVIQQSTVALDMVDLQLALLDIRARSWSACGKFEKALEDARSMQQLAPSSARGYYRQGRICAQQGHHSKAIEIYKSTETLTIVDDALRDDINIAMKESTHQVETKIDMISMLPMDIVSLIASKLFRVAALDKGHDYHTCLDVSKTWRERLLHSGALSYSVDGCSNNYRQSNSTLSLSNGHNQIIHHAQYILSLTIRTNNEPFYALADRGCFSSLTYLSIKSFSSICDLKKSYTSLHKLNSTLRHLEIVNVTLWREDVEKTLSVPDILRACSNLISLKTDKVIVNRGPLSVYPTLKQLELHSHETLEYDDVRTILQSFPALQRLVISHVKHCKILSSMHDYCPGLQYIEFNRVVLKSGPQPKPTISTAKTGLSHLHINGNTSLVTMDDIVKIIMRHCNNLERLTLDLPNDIKVVKPQSWRVENASFDRLTHVLFSIRDPSTLEPQQSDLIAIRYACQFFGYVLCNAPKVEHLCVAGAAIDDLVLHPSLSQLHQLHTLDIRNADTGGAPETVYANREDILQHALEEYRVHCSIHQRLKKIKLITPLTNTALLDPISQLKNIEKLLLSVDGSFGDDNIVFLQNMAETLVHLDLHAGSISDSLVYQLARLKHLQHLVLYAPSSLSDVALCCFSACRQLKTLSIPYKTEDVIRNIQLAIPDIRLNKI